MTGNSEMEEIKEELAKVSKVAYEFEKYKKTKAVRIRNIIIIILSILLVASNLCWLLYERSMETVEETTETVTIEGVEQSAENNGQNFIVGGDYTNGNAED